MDCQESCMEELKHYAENNYGDELMCILLNEDIRQHYSVTIDTMSLFESNVTFAHLLFEFPERALKLLDQSFHQAALHICNSHKRMPNMAVRGTIHVRLTALPQLPEIYRTSLPHCSDVGQFMCISGTVIRKTACKILEFRKLWKCKKCRYQFTIDAEVEKGYIFEKPTVCPNPEWCNGKNFTLLSTDVDPMYCKDYCEVKIQQQFNTLSVGSVPRSMWVILEDDLVDTCHPGNDVNVSGVLIQRWKPLNRGNFADIDLVLFSHNVEVKNKMIPGVLSESLALEFGKFWLDNQSDPLKGRDFILSCICPQVFGLYIVKLAVALILAGGVEKKDENSRIRGDSHLLLVGDPGTGKSQFLKFASKVCMRTVLTSGIGTTNAGLTVSAVKESGKWQLEAGALVLADGGLCCIDEFSCIKEQDKTCIHEAMEQQTISVAKAGLVCSLSTKCSILAATNPKGKYDANLSLSENTALASPLLSRFDVILVLLDTYDENWDNMVSSYILDGHNYLAKSNQKSSWSVSKMRSYFNMIRHIHPKMTASCEKVLQTYYRRQRSLEGRNFARTTPRLLQSLIRLAEGHARLMFRDEVLVIDAIMAIILMESSMSGSAVLDGLTTLHTSFPDNPRMEYNEKAKTVLKLLNLEDLLPHSENYGFSYQDLCIKKLLSEVTITFKSNKSNSHLFGTSDFSETSHTLEEQNEYIPDDTANVNISPISLNSSDILKSTKDGVSLNTVLNSEWNQESTKVSNISEKKISATTLDNLNANHNEISTLSDLKNMFDHDFLEQSDTSEHFLQNFFKRKHTNEFNSKNKQIDKNPTSEGTSEKNFSPKNTTSSESAIPVSTSPQAKRVALTRPQNIESLKKFTFLKPHRSGIYQVTENHQISESPYFNQGTSNVNVSENKETHLLQSSAKNDETPMGKTNKKIENAVSAATGSHVNTISNVLDSETVLNLIAPNSTSAVDQNCNPKSTETILSRNENPTESSSGEKRKLDTRLQKFLFKGKSKKSESTDSTATDSSSTSSVSNVTSSEHTDENTKNTTNILSSQRAFKRIFTTCDTEEELELDDPFFKI
ncbi:DNA helicase MCM9 [Araneus ventricosus]|uniref:DNA helicase MCM9 n=1 Tax=Araneus ventricosus TaxID=182803 RepID=A0A4Y2JWY8_ARAVE|nr:DNA helicase MCM9 [Araneus ventricosus]